MKSSLPVIAVALLAAAALVGCEHPKSATYDPQYDGITPVSAVAPDMSILENQKTLYEKLAAANSAAPHPAPAAPAPATPAAPSTPPPPQG